MIFCLGGRDLLFIVANFIEKNKQKKKTEQTDEEQDRQKLGAGRRRGEEQGKKDAEDVYEGNTDIISAEEKIVDEMEAEGAALESGLAQQRR